MAALDSNWMESLLSQSLWHSLVLGLAQQQVDLMVTFGSARLPATLPPLKKKVKTYYFPGVYYNLISNNHYIIL